MGLRLQLSSRNEITHLFEGYLAILTCVNHIRRRFVDSFRLLRSEAAGGGWVEAAKPDAVCDRMGGRAQTVLRGAEDEW